jgi:uncharacterized membrane protein YphA (DoxX/SURF4 family)
MNLFGKLLHTNAPWAVLLARLLVGRVFLLEGMKKFLFSDQWGAGRFARIGHQGRDVAVFCAPNEIAFPMTGDGAVLDFCGPFPDGNGIYDLTMSGYATYQDLAVESDG